MRTLQSFYRTFDRRYFGNGLPKDTTVTFSSQRLRKGEIERVHVHGLTRCENKKCAASWIDIHPELKASPALAIMTLFHAMVHLSALQGDDKRLDHGPAFHRKMKQLAARGAINPFW
jgi:hypothetical protein